MNNPPTPRYSGSRAVVPAATAAVGSAVAAQVANYIRQHPGVISREVYNTVNSIADGVGNRVRYWRNRPLTGPFGAQLSSRGK